jgi:hypothetical protein
MYSFFFCLSQHATPPPDPRCTTSVSAPPPPIHMHTRTTRRRPHSRFPPPAACTVTEAREEGRGFAHRRAGRKRARPSRSRGPCPVVWGCPAASGIAREPARASPSYARGGGAPIPADPAQLRGEGGTCRPPPSWRINGGEGGLWPPFACPACRGRARTAHVGRAPQFATRAKRESSPLCTRGEPGGRGAHWGARTFRAPPPPFRMPHRGRMRAERGGGEGESPPLQCVCKAGALPLCTCGKPGGEGAHYGAAWQRGRARAKGRGRTLRAPPRVSRLSHPLPFRMPHRGRARAERGKGEPPHFAARAKRGAPSLHVWRTGGRGRALRAATGEGEGKGGVLFAPRPAPFRMPRRGRGREWRARKGGRGRGRGRALGGRASTGGRGQRGGRGAYLSHFALRSSLEPPLPFARPAEAGSRERRGKGGGGESPLTSPRVQSGGARPLCTRGELGGRGHALGAAQPRGNTGAGTRKGRGHTSPGPLCTQGRKGWVIPPVRLLRDPPFVRKRGWGVKGGEGGCPARSARVSCSRVSGGRGLEGGGVPSRAPLRANGRKGGSFPLRGSPLRLEQNGGAGSRSANPWRT